MVPRIARRGHSFKGAGQYYLHDKEAQTKDRVPWSYCHNIPTQDPEKAMKWMAYTAMSADRLKREAGVPATGRKSTAGPVYSFSLAWHPHQNPDQETMLEAVIHTLGLLDLDDHEAVVVAHNDRDHPHVHVICNLVHPETGKTTVQSYDRLIMSAWAEEYEKNEGEIRCEQRVINNEKRRQGASLTKQFGLIKHREKKLQLAYEIQKLYERSDGAKAFQSALEHKGYTLAQGDRRGYVLVDRNGDIHSLSRQLKGQRAKDLKAQLGHLKDLPHAKTISDERMYFDRDKYEADQQIRIVDAAIEHEQVKPDQKSKTDARKDFKRSSPKQSGYSQPNEEIGSKLKSTESDDYLNKLDALRAWERQRDLLRDQLRQQQDEQYDRKGIVRRMDELEKQLKKDENRLIPRLMGKPKDIENELAALRQSLKNVDQRIREQNEALEKKTLESKPDAPSAEEIKQKRREYIQRMKEQQERSNNRDRGPNLDR